MTHTVLVPGLLCSPRLYERVPMLVAQQEANLARPDSPLLPRIACPAAVVHGAGDRLIALENGEGLAAAIPGARRTVPEGCGHLSALERPSEVGAALGGLEAAA